MEEKIQLIEVAKKTSGSRALFEYISNKRRNSRSLDLKRIYTFLKQDDDSLVYDELLSCAEELSRLEYGKLIDGKLVLTKPLSSLSLKPWNKERRKKYTKRVISNKPIQSTKCQLIIGGLRVDLPPEKAFDILKKISNL